jgi:peptidoglycan/LPS O-acetylase OafA/YrhL
MAAGAERERFYELDLLRFLAAVAVVLFHYTFRGAVGGGPVPFELPVLDAVSRYGYLGVDLFFMISGFVILLSAWDRTPGRFVVSRVSRLYPAYWLACTLTALVVWLAAVPGLAVEPRQYVANLTMVHEAFHIASVDGVYWTLFVELRFYALVGALLLLGLVRRIELFLAAWLAVAGASYLGLESRVVDFFLIPEWCSYFVAGCVCYLVRRNGFNPKRTALLLASFGLSVLFAVERQAQLAVDLGRSFDAGVLVATIALFYVVFVAVALGWLRGAGGGWLLTLGALTYPLYLVHQAIGYVLLRALHPHVGAGAAVVIVIAAMLAVAWCIQRFIEPYGSARLRELLSAPLQRLDGLVARAPALLRASQAPRVE